MTETVLQTEGLTSGSVSCRPSTTSTSRSRQAEFRSVIGPNGAGKTTTFNLITGALIPTEGTVRFNGEDITTLPPHERVHRGVGRSFQITNVFGGLTVRENVRLAAQSVHGDEISSGEAMFRDKDSFPELTDRTNEILSQIGLRERAEEKQHRRWPTGISAGWKSDSCSRPTPNSSCWTSRRPA